MKKNISIILPVFVLSLLILLPACESPVVSTPSQQVQTLSPNPTQPPATVTTAPKPTQPPPTPTNTETPLLAEVKILPTTYDQPGKWVFRHPYSDPNAPRLISMALDGFRLDPDFEVASIDLSYRWVGIGEEVRDYQRIERRGESYWKNDTKVSTEAVERLVQSIAHLSAQPHTLSVTTHTDDYPFWTFELTGLNGERILLYSLSNSSNNVPWNVIYNGEIYTQFDGGIPAALFDLFTVVLGETIASTWSPQEEGYLWATTIDQAPGELTRGFNGLLPLNDSFGYFVDPQKGELRGLLSGDKWTYHLNVGDVDWFFDLQKVELDVGDGKTVTCPFENVPMDYPEGAGERFKCPIDKPGASPSYRFPIRLTFTTSSGEPYSLSGELVGYWQPETVLPVVPYPEEISKILASSSLSRDLVRDHIIYAGASYGMADAVTGQMEHQWEAQLVLLGQAQFGERIIPYAIEFDDIKIEDGKVINWNLDRSELLALLQDALAQKITQRFLEMEPKPVLNLYYGGVFDPPFFTDDELQQCADIPLPEELPLPGKPLRGFSFNLPIGSWFYSIQLLLLDDGLRLYEMDIDPTSPADAFWTSMLPAALKSEDAPSFSRIFSRMGWSMINVIWANDATPTEVSYYRAMFAGWETEDLIYDPGLVLLNRQLELMPDGSLVLVDCTTP